MAGAEGRIIFRRTPCLGEAILQGVGQGCEEGAVIFERNFDEVAPARDIGREIGNGPVFRASIVAFFAEKAQDFATLSKESNPTA